MGDVLNEKSCRMQISTYSSIQTVKYTLRAKKTTSVKYFGRKDILLDPIKPKVCLNLRTSSKRYREEKETEAASLSAKRQLLAVKEDSQKSKAASRRTIQAAQKQARKTHLKALMSKRK